MGAAETKNQNAQLFAIVYAATFLSFYYDSDDVYIIITTTTRAKT